MFVVNVQGSARNTACIGAKGSAAVQRIVQIGRKIIVNVELALELAGKKTGGRK